jgi:GNAT superfamily N-acetyltransferase
MIGFIREFAKREGVERVELNMWEFNQDALAFYKSVGFVTYRRFMKLK